MQLKHFLTRKVSNGVAVSVILFSALFAPATGAVTSLLGNNIFVGGDLEVTGDIIVGDVIAPQYLEVSFVAPTADQAVSQPFFIASQKYEVVGVKELHGTATSSSLMVQITKDNSAVLPGGGIPLLSNNSNAGFDIHAAANVVNSGTLTSHLGDRQLAVGNRLSVKFSGAVSIDPGLVVTVTLKRYDVESTDDSPVPSPDPLTVTWNGPASHGVSLSSQDNELFNFSLTPAANLEVCKTTLTFTGSQDMYVGHAYLTDIKVVDTSTSAVVAGPFDLASATNLTETKVLANTYALATGVSRTFKVTADVAADAPAGMTFNVSLGRFTTNSSLFNTDSSAFVTSGVSPDAVIAGNTMTVVGDASLDVTYSSTPVSQTYIQGTQNASIAGFSLQAGDGGDVTVNSLVLNGFIDDADGNSDFVAGTDTDPGAGPDANINDSIVSAKLWYGSTQIGDTEAPTSGGVLNFDSLNLTVPSGQTLTLTLTVNFAASIASVTDDGTDRIHWTLDPADVDATDLNGDAISVGGSVTMSNNMTISEAGTLTAERAPDDTESEAANVVGGASNAVLAKFKFTAQREELKVTKAQLKTSGTTGISSLSLYDGSTLVGGPVSVNGSGEANFTGVNFIVPKDGTKTLTVKGNLSSVGTSGAASGTNIAVNLDYNTNFEALGNGAGSSTTLTYIDNNDNDVQDDADILGRNKLLRKTKPTVSLVALPTTTLVSGDVTALRFSISADAAGDVAIRGLRAELTPSGGVGVAATADSSVRRVGDGANRPGSATYAGTTLSVVFADEEVISAGTTRTFDVRVTLSGANGDDSLSSRLLGDTALETGTVNDANTNDHLGLGGSDDEYNFIWSDISALPHSDDLGSSSDDWTNATYVKTFPSDAQTMTE